ncbi:MAG: PAQR family membrane homeostasis protein TrhA [Bacillota bacterium]|uniref:Hemolysin D n=3 Tax=Fictibacillus TaxID=1329200 RepID=A0A160IRP6_9BACL|nr:MULTISPECIES: hemolysin III family protein [Bacillaceae]MBN3553719.1 hemolysin III family protein [Fictibacillus nanhaiensis]ANC79086.1 hemolysin D [Fictibacillus phosphorivorans]MBH0158392.1 hemolysin III family protein [Fictibacillus sp. 5RED26]MBH0162179.1 hemolysin III family protein [Fictibacillus sp. 26RED30]MBH0164535.1 hemolysin III family protein [Fictibacillus sp. 7GRE50]
MSTHVFSKREEIANAITHGLGVLLSVAVTSILLVFAVWKGTAVHIVSFAVFGGTMLTLYSASTLVHAFPKGRVKDLFEIMDHAAIYLFIAGTYTPIVLIVVGGALGWTLFGVVWGLAIFGVVFKVFFTKKFVVLSTLGYVAMGWLITFAFQDISANMPPAGIQLLVAGGIIYTLGSIFYVWRSFPFHHAVWHLFVLAGSVMHFLMMFYVLPN